MNDSGDHGDPERRRHVQHEALGVFARHGFRKASMHEIAQQAGISRPGLYFLFSDKETLFRETMRQALDGAFSLASAALADTSSPLGNRIVTALDAWLGRFVGTSIDADTGALLESSTAQLGTMYDDYRFAFYGLLTETLRRETAYDGDDAAEVAELLHTIAIGWKHELGDRADFAPKLAVAVRLLGFALAEAHPGA